MAVLVQRDGRAGVAQQAGEGHNVHPFLHAPGGEGVPEAVDVGVGDPRLPDTPLEQILVGAPLVGVPVFLTEHIALRVVRGILFPDGHLDLMVVEEVLVEGIHDENRSPGVVGLGGLSGGDTGGGLDGVVKVGEPGADFADLETSVFQVHILPPQAAQFTDPQPREEIKDDGKGGGLRGHAGGGDEPPLLVTGQYPHLLFGNLRQPYIFHDIGCHQSVLHSLTEGQVHHVAHVGQCFRGKAAGLAHVPLRSPLVEKVLQFIRGEGVHIFVPNLWLDMGADVQFVTAVGGEFDNGFRVFFQPAVHCLTWSRERMIRLPIRRQGNPGWAARR